MGNRTSSEGSKEGVTEADVVADPRAVISSAGTPLYEKDAIKCRLGRAYDSHKKVTKFVATPDKGIGLICKVYDGDSFTLLCEVGGLETHLTLRIKGIDTPEIPKCEMCGRK